MDITQITQLISLVLAVSLASERLVTLLKTLIPWLVGPPAGTADVPEKWRQVTVMLITFVIAWLTASFLKGRFNPWESIILKTDSDVHLPFWFIGFLASGGSAFWASLLGYTSAVKNLRTHQLVSEKLALKAQLFSNTRELTFRDQPPFVKSKQIADAVETEVRQIILKVSELPGTPSDLDPTSKLSDLGFNTAMCNDLAGRLDTYVKTINPRAGVNNAEILPSMTVQQVIDLVKHKISQ